MNESHQDSLAWIYNMLTCIEQQNADSACECAIWAYRELTNESQEFRKLRLEMILISSGVSEAIAESVAKELMK